MRGEDRHQQEMFLYATLEDLVPPDHPLRPIRAMVDRALKALDGRFDEIYGSPSARFRWTLICDTSSQP